MEDKIYLDKEFDKFWQKIENNENFALLRYGDGERAIMCAEKVKAQEGWESTNYISKLGEALLSTLKEEDEKIFYGISCPCCDNKAYFWYTSRIKNKNITFANLWVNSNYKKFFQKFSNLKKDAILIANYRAKGHKIGNLNILKHYEIGDDCISFWENEAPKIIQQIKDDFGSKNDLLYVVSAGPMSEPIIIDLFKNNPNNCYIDFGSSIDMFIHNKQTRPYMDETTIYAQQKCWMYNPKTINLDVSVILTLYKRPQYLETQLKAIENQSLKPKEILLYQDGTGDNIKIPEHLKERFNLIEISPINKGVWERFNFARKNAKSKYVCIFDDDTIPASRWLENCMCEMLQKEGLYGAIGIISQDEKYDPEHFKRAGWCNNNNETLRVDFVGHSWFLKKDWLDYLFEGTQELQKYKICAEDMTLSFKLQRHDINTYVPKQPISNKEFLGSIKGEELGSDENSLFLANGFEKMSEAFSELVSRYCFRTIEKTDNKYYRKVINSLSKPKSKIFHTQKANEKTIINILGIKFTIKTPEKDIDKNNFKFKNHKIRLNSVLIVEPNPYHSEILPSYIKYFQDLGFKIDLFLRHENLKDLPEFDKSEINIFEGCIKHIKKCLKLRKIRKYEYVFFSTSALCEKGVAQSFLNYLKFKPKAKNGLLMVEHSVIPCLENYKEEKFLKQNRLFSTFGYNDVPQLTPCYFNNVKITPKSNDNIVRFSVVGATYYDCKNLNLLFEASRKLIENNISNFEIILNGSNIENIPSDLVENIIEDGKVKFKRLYSNLEKSDYILFLLDDEQGYHKRYKQGTTTGAMNLSLGFCKPAILNEAFANAYGLNNQNAIVYSKNDLFEAMKKAIELNNDNYLNLQNNLANYQQEIYNKSLKNLKQNIGKTGVYK